MTASAAVGSAGALLLAVLAAPHPSLAQSRQVVVLYDERPELPGLSRIEAGLLRGLDASEDTTLVVYRESMDLSRFGSDSYLLRLRDYLRDKYAGKQIDLVVAVMGPALDFLRQHGETAFPTVPIVFCGIDSRELGGQPLPDRVTGVLLKREFAPTLTIALALHPGTREVVVVGGSSAFDRRLLEQARDEFRAFESRVRFTWLTGLLLPDLLAHLSRLPAHALVLYSTVFQDKAGNPYVTHAVAEQVSAAASVPVYGFVDQYLGRGIVGGYLYGLDSHGEIAARLARRILDGATPAELPLVEAAASTARFDWRQLKRWGIDPGRLPPGASIAFRPPTLWSQYQRHVIVAVAVVGLQALMIGGLLLQRARRRRAETDLRESELRFRTMADTVPAMIWFEGSERRLAFVNRSWLDFTGDQCRSDPSGTWIDKVHPDDRPRCEELYSESWNLRVGFTLQCRLRRRDGVHSWVLCSGVPRYGVDQTFLGYIGSCTDISAQKDAEVEMHRHRAELAHLNRVATMGVLTASVAHELKQPLSAILLLAEAAERFLRADPPALDEVREILADIRQDDRRGGEIINRIRGLLGRQEMVRKPLELNAALDDVLRLIRMEATSRGVALTFVPGADVPEVLGDRVHLQQVVMNLVVNAIEAMASLPDFAPRAVTVRTERGDDGSAMISVTDTGPGIPEQGQLFEPYWTTKADGLGLGLAITRTIVEAHRGQIRAENNPGAGATFTVSLPPLLEVESSGVAAR